jgi:hypothetical protein
VQIAAGTNDKAVRLGADADALAAGTARSRHTMIETVRNSVADAERRMYLRVPTDAPCELVLEGTRHEGRLVNMSEGGARMTIAGHCPTGLRGELRVPLFRLSVPCNVVASDEPDEHVSVAFAVPIELPPALRETRPRAA